MHRLRGRWRAVLLGLERNPALRGRLHLLVDLVHGDLSDLRHHGRPMLRGQYLHFRLLLQQYVHRRGQRVLDVEQLQLRILQGRSLHVRQSERALLHQRQLAHRHDLRQFRPRVHDQHPGAQQLRVRSLRQVGQPMLLGQHLYRRRHTVPLRQQLWQLGLFLQAMWRHRPGMLLQLCAGRLVSRSGHRLQQHVDQFWYLRSLWRSWTTLLRQQDLHGGQHDVQQLESVRGVWHAGHLDFDGVALLRRQPVQRGMLRNPLQRHARRAGLSRRDRQLRFVRHQHHLHEPQARLRRDHGRHWHVQRWNRHLRRRGSGLLYVELHHLLVVQVLRRRWHAMPEQHQLEHGAHRVSVHGLWRQGAALLLRQQQRQRQLVRLRLRLQVPLRVHLRLDLAERLLLYRRDHDFDVDRHPDDTRRRYLACIFGHACGHAGRG